MQLTKYTHSCVRFDDGDRSLVIDPGSFSEVETALDGAGGVLVTHEHPDHIAVDKLRAALNADPRLRVWAPSSVTALLDGLDAQVVTVAPGETFDAAGFEVRAFGGQHALIHPTIPIVTNLGYLLADGVYHPGDSLTVPDVEVRTLLLPTIAPWSKAAEVIDFAVSVRAPHVFQVHDALATDLYAGLVEGLLQRVAEPFGVDFRHLAPTETVTV